MEHIFDLLGQKCQYPRWEVCGLLVESMSQLGIDPQPALAQVLCQRAAGVMPEAGSGLNEEALVAPGPPEGAQQGRQVFQAGNEA